IGGAPAESGSALLGAAGGLVGLVALQAGFRLLSVACLHRVGAGAATELRLRMLGHHLRTGPGDRLAGPDDTAALVEDATRLRDLVAHDGPRLLAEVLSLASLLGVLLVNEPLAAAIVAVTAALQVLVASGALRARQHREADRKSTRLNSSHVSISYAVFCL